MHAFSFEWPYVSFQGLKQNFFFTLNAFDPILIHRIELEKEEFAIKNHFKVLATVITTTNDLFVLSKAKDNYTVCMFDLDYSNKLEQKRKTDIFKKEIIMTYTAE